MWTSESVISGLSKRRETQVGSGRVGVGKGEAEGPHPRRREENEDTFAHGLGFAVAVVLSSLFPSVFLSLRFCFAIQCLSCEN